MAAYRRRGAALTLIGSGVLSLQGSFGTWGSCPTTPCGGALQAISEYSGIGLGFGVITALAGLALTVIGVAILRHIGAAPIATVAAVFALVIVLGAGASVAWMYIIPGEDTEFYWPPYGSIYVGGVGLVALAASLMLRRTPPALR